jgi:hypothetical protein
MFGAAWHKQEAICAASSWNSKAPDSNSEDCDRFGASPAMRMPWGA